MKNYDTGTAWLFYQPVVLGDRLYFVTNPTHTFYTSNLIVFIFYPVWRLSAMMMSNRENTSIFERVTFDFSGWENRAR